MAIPSGVVANGYWSKVVTISYEMSSKDYKNSRNIVIPLHV